MSSLPGTEIQVLHPVTYLTDWLMLGTGPHSPDAPSPYERTFVPHIKIKEAL